MTGKLFVQTLVKFLLGVVLTAVLLFCPAGTLAFARGWLFLAVLFVPMLIAGVVLMVKAPELLQKRLRSKETAREQDRVVKLSGLMFLLGFVAAGFNHRFGWYVLPMEVSLAAAVVFLVGYLLYARVLRENEFLSRVIEIQENQRVIDTGMYALVRHPMYSATLLLFLSMPLILGSVISFVIFLAYPILIAKRIRNEEQVLSEGLPGYREYCHKVRWRLLPLIW